MSGDPGKETQALLARLAEESRHRFEAHRHILSFADFLAVVAERPARYARNSAQYLVDAIEWFGSETVTGARGASRRYRLFDAPFDGGDEKVIGNEEPQRELLRHIRNFVREGRINRLLLVHGPNGSAKSSLVSCLMRGLESYSRTEEGALYRFHWVFPSARVEGGRIGFGRRAAGEPAPESYAYLEEDLIDCKLPAEHNDNPLFLLPRTDRERFLDTALSGEKTFALSDTVRKGDLGHRSRQVFDALLSTYRGDLHEVWRHVQVERFFVSRRYREAAVTVEPQLRVDAGVRQLTADRSLASLPAVLQSQTLFEAFGPLVEANRGIIEYNDMLKRPLDSNKYLLATSEKGTVSLDTSVVHIDCILLATANESYLEAFKQQPDWASYKGRIELIRMPYLLDFRAEQRIYDELLASLRLPVDVAPHTTFALALWTVLTRLRRPRSEGFPVSIRQTVDQLRPTQKAFLYSDGTLPAGLTAEQAQQLRAAIPRLMQEGAEGPHYEGRHGASPREMKSLLLNAAHGQSKTLSPMHVLDEIRNLIRDTTVYEWLRIEADGQYHRPDRFVDAVRDVYLDRLEREVRESTGLVDETEYQRVFERYIQHVMHSIRKEKMTDPVTGRLMDPDNGFMNEVERTLGREGSEKDFRSQVINQIAAFRIENPNTPVDLHRIFPAHFDRMREQYYESKRKELARIHRNLLCFVDGQDAELDAAERTQVQETLENLQRRFGYTRVTGREAVALLLRDRYRETGEKR